MAHRRRIMIFDTTLRDGEQSPGIVLSPDEKAEIAQALESLGVDVIEAGFAISSPGDFEGIRAVGAAVSGPTVASLARTRVEDLDAAVEALAGARGRTRVHVFIATSPIHMERKLGLEPAEVVEETRFAVSHVANRVDEVEFSCEDATRSDPAFVAEVCRTAIEAGATTVNLPDTVGYSLPEEHAAFLLDVRRRCPELERATLSVHCHNDLGLAVANTLAGIGAGATQVECTINGLGERAGNAALEEIVMALRVRSETLGFETGVNVGEIGRVSQLVSQLTGYAVQRNKAIVGASAFAHEAGIHQDGMLKDAATYQIMDPEELGLTMTLPLGKHSGRHAFRRACEQAGLHLSDEELASAFQRFKALADSRRAVTLYDVFEEGAERLVREADHWRGPGTRRFPQRTPATAGVEANQ
ncbi:MAG TPA: 2-isopropylmalate synthase [Gaiellaceae bacterium]|nr:2-isopropylmalate synthase [Gaiellaceae bacterium]